MAAEQNLLIMHDIMNRLWKFNKKFLESDLTKDSTWTEATNQVNVEVKKTEAGYQDYAAEVFNASLAQLDRIRKAEK